MEMLVALAILGVMAGAVAPALIETREEPGVREASRLLVELLQRARATAAERGVVVTLVVDPLTGRAWSGTDEQPLLEDSLARPLAASLVRARLAGNAVTITASEARAHWTFTPSGITYGDAVLLHDRVRARLIGVDRWTGETRVDPR